MSQLSNVPNLRVEDFPEQKDWIGRLFIQLNSFIQNVNQTVNGQITFPDNIAAVTQTFTPLNGFQEFSFQWPFKNRSPVSLIVCKASKGTQQDPVILVLSWSYDSSTSTITIDQMKEVSGSSIIEMSGQYQFILRASV